MIVFQCSSKSTIHSHVHSPDHTRNHTHPIFFERSYFQAFFQFCSRFPSKSQVLCLISLVIPSLSYIYNSSVYLCIVCIVYMDMGYREDQRYTYMKERTGIYGLLVYHTYQHNHTLKPGPAKCLFSSLFDANWP